MAYFHMFLALVSPWLALAARPDKRAQLVAEEASGSDVGARGEGVKLNKTRDLKGKRHNSTILVQAVSHDDDATLKGYYTFQQKSTNRYMDAHTSGEHSVVTRPAQDNDSQMWLIMPARTGVYTIQQKSNNRYLTAHLVGEALSAVTRDAQDDDSQRWLITKVEKGVYRVQGKSNNRYLDAHEQGHDHAVLLQDAEDDDRHTWLLKLAEMNVSVKNAAGSAMLVGGSTEDANDNKKKDHALYDPCAKDDETCECFEHRDQNFCNTCAVDCGPCKEYCGYNEGPAPTPPPPPPAKQGWFFTEKGETCETGCRRLGFECNDADLKEYVKAVTHGDDLAQAEAKMEVIAKETGECCESYEHGSQVLKLNPGPGKCMVPSASFDGFHCGQDPGDEYKSLCWCSEP